MNRDELFCQDVRWVHTLNSLRDKHVEERKLAAYSLERIHELQQRVLSGEFVWEVPYICKVPKKTGGFRECLALPLESRIVMSVIASVYYDTCEFMFNENCVSYQQGISVPHIVREVHNKLHNESVIGYKADLSKYFDSVPLPMVEELLDEISDYSVIDRHVWDFYHDMRLSTKDGVVTNHYRSLCQGCALSPILANLYLYDVDYTLSSKCYYKRYSDDILIIGENTDELLNELTILLEDKGLALNPKKVQSLNDEFEFLGARIGDNIHISKDNMSALKREIKTRCSKYQRTRAGQRRAIKSLQHYLFREDYNGHSLFKYYASLVSDYQDMITLDRYAVQCIRALYTGKGNYTTNVNKTPDDILQELGWVNIVDMLSLYTKDRSHYEEVARQLGGNYEFI